MVICAKKKGLQPWAPSPQYVIGVNGSGSDQGNILENHTQLILNPFNNDLLWARDSTYLMTASIFRIDRFTGGSISSPVSNVQPYSPNVDMTGQMIAVNPTNGDVWFMKSSTTTTHAITILRYNATLGSLLDTTEISLDAEYTSRSWLGIYPTYNLVYAPSIGKMVLLLAALRNAGSPYVEEYVVEINSTSPSTYSKYLIGNNPGAIPTHAYFYGYDVLHGKECFVNGNYAYHTEMVTYSGNNPNMFVRAYNVSTRSYDTSTPSSQFVSPTGEYSPPHMTVATIDGVQRILMPQWFSGLSAWIHCLYTLDGNPAFVNWVPNPFRQHPYRPWGVGFAASGHVYESGATGQYAGSKLYRYNNNAAGTNEESLTTTSYFMAGAGINLGGFMFFSVMTDSYFEPYLVKMAE